MIRHLLLAAIAPLGAGNPSREERWARMRHIISEPTTPPDLTR